MTPSEHERKKITRSFSEKCSDFHSLRTEAYQGQAKTSVSALLVRLHWIEQSHHDRKYHTKLSVLCALREHTSPTPFTDPWFATVEKSRCWFLLFTQSPHLGCLRSVTAHEPNCAPHAAHPCHLCDHRERPKRSLSKKNVLPPTCNVFCANCRAHTGILASLTPRQGLRQSSAASRLGIRQRFYVKIIGTSAVRSVAKSMV